MVLARKLRPLLYGTIGLCALAIIVSSISLSAKSWYLRSAQNVNVAQSTINMEYGLFSGIKYETFVGGKQEKELAVVCEGSLCMFSCGLDVDKRREDILNLINTQTGNDDKYCRDSQITKTPLKHGRAAGDSEFESGFFHIAYWLATIILVGMGIVFSVIGGALALYNTVESPTQPIFGVFGLYIWNACAATSSLLAMIVWGVCFEDSLKTNGAVSETIADEDRYSGPGTLGYSYWIMILPVLFNTCNLGILYFHSWKLRQSERQITQVIDDKLTNGDILLF